MERVSLGDAFLFVLLTGHSDMWNNLDADFQACGLRCSTKELAWAVVTAQRSRCLGSEISDNILGSWVAQYVEHYLATKQGAQGRTPKTFIFDTRKKYKGPQLSYRGVTAQIIAAGHDSFPKKAARNWDNAMQALVSFRTGKQTEEAWNAVVQVLRKLAHPPE